MIRKRSIVPGKDLSNTMTSENDEEYNKTTAKSPFSDLCKTWLMIGKRVYDESEYENFKGFLLDNFPILRNWISYRPKNLIVIELSGYLHKEYVKYRFVVDDPHCLELETAITQEDVQPIVDILQNANLDILQTISHNGENLVVFNSNCFRDIECIKDKLFRS